MKKIKFTEVSGKNFKGLHEFQIHFNDFVTELRGRNAVGKTSVFDCIWWVLFDKDSLGNSKFDLRELDADGNKIHNTEIVGSIKSEVDGVPYELTKTQREKWVKKRGETTTQFSGNVNEYMINGYPKSEKEFKAFIESIIGEQIFKILTSPSTFPNLDWKEQRKILFSIIGDIDTSDIESEYLELLKPELAVASIDDIKRKWTKAKNDLKKKPDEIQTRIDEVSGQIVDIDKAPLEEKKKALEAEIKTLENEYMELGGKNNNEIDSQIFELKSQQAIVVNKANNARNQKLREAESSLNLIKNKYQNSEFAIQRLESERTRNDDDKRQRIMTLNDSKEKLKKAQDAQFSVEKSGLCPTCGRELPEEQLTKARAKWEDKKREYIKSLEENISLLIENIAKRNELTDKLTKDIETAKKEQQILQRDYENASKVVEEIRKEPEVKGSDLPEFLELDSQIVKLEESRIDLAEITVQREQIRKQAMEKKDELLSVEKELSRYDNNAFCRERISDLQNELREVGQKISDCEQMLYAVDCYTKAISKKINDKFDGLQFKLFEQQINGGVKETCSITWDGVPYESLNSGHKIVAGLNIIKVLRDHYGVELPVIIDNAETINPDNIPKMDGQMILLRVTDDAKLTVQ